VRRSGETCRVLRRPFRRLVKKEPASGSRELLRITDNACGFRHGTGGHNVKRPLKLLFPVQLVGSAVNGREIGKTKRFRRLPDKGDLFPRIILNAPVKEISFLGGLLHGYRREPLAA